MNNALVVSTCPEGTTGLVDVAETMAREFVDAVKQAEANNVAQIGKQVDLITHAMQRYAETRQRIDVKRQEASRLVAESLAMEEEATEALASALQLARQGLETITADKQEGRKRLRAIAGGKRGG